MKQPAKFGFAQFVQELVVDCGEFPSYEFAVSEFQHIDHSDGWNPIKWRQGLLRGLDSILTNVEQTSFEEWPEKIEYATRMTELFKRMIA